MKAFTRLLISLLAILAPAVTTNAQQIHIKARFFEAPSANMAAWERARGDANGGTTILSAADARNLLKASVTTPGLETLAEPEAVTVSGRQVQMRATQIITVITNFASQESVSNLMFYPQSEKVETGPVLDSVATVMPDGYTIDLKTTATLTEFLGYDNPTNSPALYNSMGRKIDVPVVLPRFRVRQTQAHVQIQDGQTLTLEKFEDHLLVGTSSSDNRAVSPRPDVQDKQVLVLITVTLIDQTGSRIHPED